MQSPIPTFVHSLVCFVTILKKAEEHCDEHKIDKNVILRARLFPNMLNLVSQVRIACDTA